MWEAYLQFGGWLIRAWGIQVAVLHLTRRRGRALRFFTLIPAVAAMGAAGLGCALGLLLLLAAPPLAGIILTMTVAALLAGGGWSLAYLAGWAMAWRWNQCRRKECAP